VGSVWSIFLDCRLRQDFDPWWIVE